MVRVTRAVDFCASLRYARADCSESENRRLFGPYAQPHGHNYRLEVTLEGEPSPETGMLLDLKELKTILEREVVARFDHRDLNGDTPYFEKIPPTPEHFARILYEILSQVLSVGKLTRVRLHQEPDLWVDVVPEPGSEA